MDWFIVTTLNLLLNTGTKHMSTDIINVLKFYYKWNEISLRGFFYITDWCIPDVFFMNQRNIWYLESWNIWNLIEPNNTWMVLTPKSPQLWWRSNKTQGQYNDTPVSNLVYHIRWISAGGAQGMRVSIHILTQIFSYGFDLTLCI
jgi:hypothetical protein